MKIYISGPISLNGTATPEEIERNKAAFRTTAENLEATGYTPVSPLQNEYPGRSWNEYMRLDIILLMQSDTIFMLPGWEKSKGAILERDLALAIGIPVIE